jgi:hypothetical protein
MDRKVPQDGWNGDCTAFVEFFPSPDAGAPISNDCTLEMDLRAYIQACGVLANPDHFEVAELLMTTGLTNSARDRFLKSQLVSITYSIAIKAVTYQNMRSSRAKPRGRIVNRCYATSTSCVMVLTGTLTRLISRSAPRYVLSISSDATSFKLYKNLSGIHNIKRTCAMHRSNIGPVISARFAFIAKCGRHGGGGDNK